MTRESRYQSSHDYCQIRHDDNKNKVAHMCAASGSGKQLFITLDHVYTISSQLTTTVGLKK